MKQLILILLILSMSLSLNAQKQKEYYFKFTINNQQELEKITQIISIDNVKNNEVFAYALESELTEFKKLGYKINFIQKDIPKSLTMATTVSEMGNWDRYPTYEVYRQLMKNFESNYPTLCKLDSIGTTHDGRKLYVLNISDNVGIEEKEPEFFYTSTMHGDEATGFVLLLRLADSLLSNYNTEASIKSLIDEIDLYINPNANPDGTYNGGNNTVSDAIRSNGYADLNRDFPDPRLGDNSPYQPETQAMMDFAEDHHFVMSANFHGGAEVMNYPWDTWYTGENLHADTDWFELICTDYVNTARTVNPNYMKSVTSDGVTHGATWYKVGGGRQDYMNYWHQCKEVTIEVSVSRLLATESLNAYWSYNKQSMINYIVECLNGIKGTVKTSGNVPIEAQINVIGHDEENDSSMVFSNPDIGDYYRLIAPGTYNVEASAYGYIPDTIENVLVAENSNVEANFVLMDDPQIHSLSGNILDQINNSPLDSVLIKIINTPLANEYTNPNGAYLFNAVVEDSLDLFIYKKGYLSLDTSIAFTDADTIFNFNMFPAKVEDFENQLAYKLDFQFNENIWVISDDAYEGNYSMKSGDIGDGQSSVLYFNETITQNGVISFYQKVSSENAYDFLKFYIDGVEQDKWSGNTDWSFERFEVSEGVHTFKWTYIKDGNTSAGSDCAWIDLISLPANDTNLWITPLEIFDTLNINETSEHEIIITNQGNTSSTYTVSESMDWLEVDQTNNTVNYHESDTIKATINTSGYTPGFYDAEIHINKENQKIDTVFVHLMIRDTISSVLYPEYIIDTLYGGDNKEYNIWVTNNGVVSLDYTIEIENSIENNWINLNKNAGNLSLSESDSINATVSTGGAGFGNLQCNIIFREQDEDSLIIPVSIYVKDTIQYTIQSEFIIDTLNQDSIKTFDIIVQNNGVSTIEYTSEILIPTKADEYWATLIDSAGNIYPGNSDTIKLVINTTNLYPGEYSCAIQFQELSGKESIIPVDIHVNQLQSTGHFLSLTDLIIYPNPFNESLNLQFNLITQNNLFISIYNVNGILLFYIKLPIENRQKTIELNRLFNLEQLQPGIYFIHVSTKSGHTARKVLKL